MHKHEKAPSNDKGDVKQEKNFRMSMHYLDFVHKNRTTIAENKSVKFTVLEERVLEVILKAFSNNNNYLGEIEKPVCEEFLLKTNEQKKAYDNVIKRNRDNGKPALSIPFVRFTKGELYKALGAVGGRNRALVLEAFTGLTRKLMDFEWTRNAIDDKGKFIPSSSHDNTWKKEKIKTVETILKVYSVFEDDTLKFKYFEVSLSAIFLDQCQSYYMSIPENWRIDAKNALNGKKESVYLGRLLLWLRHRSENIRRRKGSDYLFSLSFDELAHTFGMPESLRKNQKTKAKAVLLQGLEIAKKLGYLIDFDVQGNDYQIHLNKEFYPIPKAEPKARKPKAVTKPKTGDESKVDKE
jgi:hypothetical protein